MNTIIATGSDKWTDHKTVHSALLGLVDTGAPVEIVRGAADKGCDEIVREFCYTMGIPCRPMTSSRDIASAKALVAFPLEDSGYVHLLITIAEMCNIQVFNFGDKW